MLYFNINVEEQSIMYTNIRIGIFVDSLYQKLFLVSLLAVKYPTVYKAGILLVSKKGGWVYIH